MFTQVTAGWTDNQVQRGGASLIVGLVRLHLFLVFFLPASPYC